MNEEKLRIALSEAHSLLVSVGEEHWSGKINEFLKKDILEDGDKSSIARWFGGMGSFNDLLICGVNGHQIQRHEEARINDNLDDLRSEIYKLTQGP